VRLVGVGVTGLVAKGEAELGLLASPERARRERLNRAVDALAERFGAGAVRPGGLAEVTRAGLSLQRKRGIDPGG
jgi:hypothetical protein